MTQKIMTGLKKYWWIVLWLGVIAIAVTTWYIFSQKEYKVVGTYGSVQIYQYEIDYRSQNDKDLFRQQGDRSESDMHELSLLFYHIASQEMKPSERGSAWRVYQSFSDPANKRVMKFQEALVVYYFAHISDQKWESLEQEYQVDDLQNKWNVLITAYRR